MAIAGAVVYSGTGCYDYTLELLCDSADAQHAQAKWETLESVSGSYDQDVVTNDMAELKFDRPVHIKVCFISIPSEKWKNNFQSICRKICATRYDSVV